MNDLTAALLGAAFGLGVILTVAGVRGTTSPTSFRATLPDRLARVDRLAERVVAGLVAGALMLAVTGWVVGGVLAGAGAAVAPTLLGAKGRRASAIQRTEAIAAWAEMLRDTMAAANALTDAIEATARVAPPAIRTEVQALALRARHRPLPEALRRFATEVDDPVADTVVAGLLVAAKGRGAAVGEVLTAAALAAREKAGMRLRVEAARAHTYASAQFLVIITLVGAAAMIALAPDYLEPFGTALGQMMLAVIGGLFGTGLWALHQLALPGERRRVLAVTDTREASR